MRIIAGKYKGKNLSEFGTIQLSIQIIQKAKEKIFRKRGENVQYSCYFDVISQANEIFTFSDVSILSSWKT